MSYSPMSAHLATLRPVSTVHDHLPQDHEDLRCEQCSDWPLWWFDLVLRIERLSAALGALHEQHTLLTRIDRKLNTMTSNQEHLNADVDALKAAVATVIQELKAQAAAGQPLDFTAADQLLADTQAEAAADAPPTP